MEIFPNWEIRWNSKFQLPLRKTQSTKEAINVDRPLTVRGTCWKNQDKTSGNCEFWHALEGKCRFGCKRVIQVAKSWLCWFTRYTQNLSPHEKSQKVLWIYQVYSHHGKYHSVSRTCGDSKELKTSWINDRFWPRNFLKLLGRCKWSPESEVSNSLKFIFEDPGFYMHMVQTDNLVSIYLYHFFTTFFPIIHIYMLSYTI